MRTMPTFLALASMTTLASSASAAGIPAIGVIEAPGVICPSTEAVQAALARVRGGAAAAGEPAFKLFVDRTAEVAHVDLRNGAGESVLARDIPMTSADCAHAAEAIALIVERHFRSLEWSPAARATSAGPVPAAPSATAPPPWPAPPVVPPPAVVPPPSLPRPPPGAPLPSPAAAVSPSPVAPTPAPLPPAALPVAEAPAAPADVAATATATASPSRATTIPLPRLVLGAGPALWSRNETFAVALDARWRIAADGPIELGGKILLPPLHASTALASGGSVHVGAVPVAASVGLTEALGRMAVAAHAGALWTIERGQSDGIPAPATAWRTVLGLGLGASAAWLVAPRLRITAALDAYRTVLGRSYAIDGVPGTVLDPSPWQAVVVLGAEWVVMP